MNVLDTCLPLRFRSCAALSGSATRTTKRYSQSLLEASATALQSPMLAGKDHREEDFGTSCSFSDRVLSHEAHRCLQEQLLSVELVSTQRSSHATSRLKY